MVFKNYPELIKIFFVFWQLLNFKRKRQFALIVFLTFVSGFAEVISIGLLLPFLSFLATPEVFSDSIFIKSLNSIFGNFEDTGIQLYLTLLFISSVIFSAFLRFLYLFVSTRFSFIVGAEIIQQVFNKAINRDYSEHINENSSELLNIITTKTNILISGILNPLMIFIGSLVLVIFTLMTLIYIDANITFFVISFFGGLYLLIYKFVRNRLKTIGEVISEESTKIIKVTQESILGIREVIINNHQNFFQNLLSNSIFVFKRAQGDVHILNGSPRFLIESLGIILITIFAYRYHVSTNGGLLEIIPILGVFTLASQKILPAVQQIYGAIVNINSSSESLKDVENFLNRDLAKTSLDSIYRKQCQNEIQFNSDLIFKKVAFSYGPKKTPTLKNINIKISKGDKVGIVGRTGAGKSTFIDILSGLLQPTNGSIYIDGKRVETLVNDNWRVNIAHVPQTFFLLDGTIKENIAFGHKVDDIDYEKLIMAAKVAEIDSFISCLDGKYEEVVGENGIKLSGGQRQRIAIARSIYQRANFLILDEATSSLDALTESKVLQNISGLDNDITIIFITHRQSSLAICDYFFEIQEGEMVKKNIDEYFEK